MTGLKSIIERKPIQIGLLILWVGTVLWVFVPHLIHNIPKSVDKKLQVDCQSLGNTHKIKLGSFGFDPKKIEARSCDIIEITNVDQSLHQPAFGPHPIHLIYPDFNERSLAPQRTNKFILKAYGRYQVHDHLNEDLKAELNISK